MVAPGQVLTKLAEVAPVALILGGGAAWALVKLLEHLRTTQESFLGFLRERETEDAARAQQVQAAFDRNTAALARNTAALDRLDDRERRIGDRRAVPGA